MKEILESLSTAWWPLAIAIASITFLVFSILFRSEIANLISRISSVTKEGIKAELPPEAQNQESRKLAVEELMNLGLSVTRDETEKLIFDDLEKRNLDTKGDTIRVLVRHFAATRMALDFLQIYHSILGGQIVILKELNQMAGVGLVEQDVEAIYTARKALAGRVLDAWDLQGYLTYLYNNLLITKKDDRLHITHKGKDFLVWLPQAGMPENKGY